MFWKIFAFELRYRLKRPATYAYFAILFLFGLLSGIYGDGPTSEKVYVNSAYTIAELLIFVSIFQMLIASAIMGVPVYRDIEYKTKDYFFTYPMGEKAYLLGRYFGSFVVLVLICLGTYAGYILGNPIGIAIGELEPERFGPVEPWYFVYNTLVFTIPNLFFTGTLFFALVALTRNVFVTYVTSVLLFIAYLLMVALTQDLDNKQLVDILDPFAYQTFTNTTKYWTPVEQNTSLVSLSGNVLWNRLLWSSVSIIVFCFVFFRFSFRAIIEPRNRKRAQSQDALPQPVEVPLPAVRQKFKSGDLASKMFRLAWLEFWNIVKDVYFIALILAGVIFLFLDGWFGFPTFGTPSLPLTYYMIETKDSNYILFVFIILIFYTGEVVHRDRSVGYSAISDALPVPNWTLYGSKFLALLLVCFVLVNLVLVCGLANQVIAGYYDFQLWMYFTDLYLIELPEYIELTMLAFIVHILVNNKFVGHVCSIAVWILLFSLRVFADIDYNLFFYSYVPGYRISDMNGFGHSLEALGWFNFYWLSLGVILLLLGSIFWNRGSETSFRVRWKVALSRLNGPIATALIIMTLLWIGSGAYIYYNVSVLNEYFTQEQQNQQGADFERKYKRYENAIQPKIVRGNLAIDIFPYDRKADATASYTIANKTDQKIDSLIFQLNPIAGYVKLERLQLDGADLQALMKDTVQRFYIYRFPKPLLPGDSGKLDIGIKIGYKGFANSGFARQVVYNGSFFDLSIFPQFGYPGDPLTSDKERRKRGLPASDWNLPAADDPKGLRNLLFNDDADYVTMDVVISTSKDQIAVSPGYLQRTWEEGDRKYFHYKLDELADLFANFSSARYQVTKDEWKGKAGETVAIEIFHHPTHTYNLDRFTKSVKASLTYFSENYHPYQYRQMRILEFPRYAAFAQSFPNTVPYSESFGWAADFSDPEDTDYAFFVTSHEVAHQWWGHMVTPSRTRGANQISETMAEYSALMVQKHEYGEECMQRFLKYSLDRYLSGRANESKFEATLLDNEASTYIWYQKGSLVLYALQDMIGEERLNIAFRNFLDTAAFRYDPPFATSLEWYQYIRQQVPDSLQYYLTDSFEKITLYENRITEATYEPTNDKKFKVTMKINSKKIYYDKTGAEIGAGDQPNYIEVGVFAEDEKNSRGMTKKVPLYLKKHWLKPGETTLTCVVEKEPVKAGVDPYNKLIDRIPDDNTKSVEKD